MAETKVYEPINAAQFIVVYTPDTDWGPVETIPCNHNHQVTMIRPPGEPYENASYQYREAVLRAYGETAEPLLVGFAPNPHILSDRDMQLYMPAAYPKSLQAKIIDVAAVDSTIQNSAITYDELALQRPTSQLMASVYGELGELGYDHILEEAAEHIYSHQKPLALIRRSNIDQVVEQITDTHGVEGIYELLQAHIAMILALAEQEQVGPSHYANYLSPFENLLQVVEASGSESPNFYPVPEALLVLNVLAINDRRS